jgi:ssDNA-binding Zn-finger/Zn-ribbon topoisomerase 1
MWDFITILCSVAIIFYVIKAIYRYYLQSIRDKAARDFFEKNKINFDYEEESVERTISKLNNINFEKDVGKSNKRFALSFKDFIRQEACPKCKKGNLIIRKGKYGKFIGCTRYPDCRYTEGTEKLKGRRKKFKKDINEEIRSKIKEAYS